MKENQKVIAWLPYLECEAVCVVVGIWGQVCKVRSVEPIDGAFRIADEVDVNTLRLVE